MFVDGLRRVRSRLGRLLGDRPAALLKVLTPEEASPAGRIALLVGAVGGLAAAGVLAIGALGLLLLALGVIYWLLTHVLGVELGIDPEAFLAQLQRQARPSASS